MSSLEFWIIFVAVYVGGFAAFVYTLYELLAPAVSWFMTTRMKK